MIPYIALLRGINIGGRNKILMAELRALCAELGWADAQTYIQSGNLRLALPIDADTDHIAQILHGALQGRFGYDVPVLVRPQAYFEARASAHPAAQDPTVDPKNLHFTFLLHPPAPERIQALADRYRGDDSYWIDGDCVYLHCPKGYGRTPLTNTYLEKQLGQPATTRNWRSTQKLATW